MSQISLKLYLSGRSARSNAIKKDLQETLEFSEVNDVELDVIDILEHPELAEDELILVTPTLIRVFPLPQKRLFGDFSNRTALLSELDLNTP